MGLGRGAKLSMPKAAKLIDETLAEERKADDTLSKVAVDVGGRTRNFR
jgi:ferritin-like metal-binding protein YciE